MLPPINYQMSVQTLVANSDVVVGESRTIDLSKFQLASADTLYSEIKTTDPVTGKEVVKKKAEKTYEYQTKYIADYHTAPVFKVNDGEPFGEKTYKGRDEDGVYEVEGLYTKNGKAISYKLGYPVNIQFKSIFPEGERGNLNMLAKGLNVKNSFEQWIGIAPFAAHQGKVYPPQLMHQVIEQLLQKYPKARIFLFGRGQQEEQYFTEWTKEYKACVYVCKNVESLHQELILMSHLDVMISMDSSNMHLASLTGTPVVSVWGATHPYAGFLGWGQDKANIVQVDLDCRPCSIYGQKPCRRGDYACMNNISPKTIVEKVEHILSIK